MLSSQTGNLVRCLIQWHEIETESPLPLSGSLDLYRSMSHSLLGELHHSSQALAPGTGSPLLPSLSADGTPAAPSHPALIGTPSPQPHNSRIKPESRPRPWPPSCLPDRNEGMPCPARAEGFDGLRLQRLLDIAHVMRKRSWATNRQWGFSLRSPWHETYWRWVSRPSEAGPSSAARDEAKAVNG